MDSAVSVVVCTYNAMPWIEPCLESVRGHETIVVDNGSTDDTLALVRKRFPEAIVVEQGNRGLAAGWNAGIARASHELVFLLNADAWVVDDALEQLARFLETHPQAGLVGPLLRNPDGSLQRSVRGFPTRWRLATEFWFLRKLAPRSEALNGFYAGSFAHDRERAVDWVMGAALLVRKRAIEEIGGLDEDFFLFSEEVDLQYRLGEAGWERWFTPAAEVTHVGGASHGGTLFKEILRGHLRYFAKHHGPAEAERVRTLLERSLRVRGLLFRAGGRGEAYREGARWLASGAVPELLAEPR
jgi:N-acetylglucosaminyl-diphospho-decaprenol L-rhamnosyltransferase